MTYTHTCRVKGEGKDVLPEGVGEEEGVMLIVPYPERPVLASRHQERLPEAGGRVLDPALVVPCMQWTEQQARQLGEGARRVNYQTIAESDEHGVLLKKSIMMTKITNAYRTAAEACYHIFPSRFEKKIRSLTRF